MEERFFYCEYCAENVMRSPRKNLLAVELGRNDPIPRCCFCGDPAFLSNKDEEMPSEELFEKSLPVVCCDSKPPVGLNLVEEINKDRELPSMELVSG